MKSLAKKKDGTIKAFEFVAVLKIKNAGELRISKKSLEPKTAVVEAVRALEKQVRRFSEKRERSRTTVGTSLKPVREFKMEVFR